MKIKVISIVLVVILVANLTLFVLKRVEQTTFWVITIVIGLIAYKVIPWLREKST
jgi:hypothetical protein